MKILVLNYEYPPLGGGAGPVCRQLCELYARRGHQVEVVTMGFRGLPRREFLNGVDITRVPAIRKHQATCDTMEMISYVVSAMPVVVKRLINNRYDIAHCHFVVPTGLLAWLTIHFRHIPWVITSHGSDIPGFNPDRFTREHRIMTPLLRWIMRSASQVVSPSLYLKDLIDRNTGFSNVMHIPNGIDVHRFAPRAKARKILMTGRLLPRKGFQHVLHALSGLETDFEVHLAGDGPLRAEMESIARNLRCNVIFHGWLEHDSPVLRELYETSSIFCLPSKTENASVALLEAMSSGMAVIASNTAGSPETVGDTGRLVAPEDVEGLRRCLTELMKDDELRKKLGDQARQRILDNFDWEIIGSKYLDLFSSLKRSR